MFHRNLVGFLSFLFRAFRIFRNFDCTDFIFGFTYLSITFGSYVFAFLGFFRVVILLCSTLCRLFPFVDFFVSGCVFSCGTSIIVIVSFAFVFLATLIISRISFLFGVFISAFFTILFRIIFFYLNFTFCLIRTFPFKQFIFRFMV